MDKIPIIDINKDNLSQLYPSISYAIKNSSFIALDLELSGIGDRKKIMAKSLEDRFNGMSEVAKTRAILSIGISCFSLRNSDLIDEKVKKFMVQTFNILVLCTEDYVVEPASLGFLVSHGFDFNRQYSSGLPYHRGNDKAGKLEDSPSVRNLFSEILKSHHPIVLHNGFVDLIFLYQNLYAELPTTLSVFSADITDMFTAGIYDTKYFSEFKSRISASYLEYVFRKQQRINSENRAKGKEFVHLQFPNYPKEINVEYRNCSLRKRNRMVEGSAVCQNYATFGWCDKSKECTLSHDIDVILDAEATKRMKKNRRRNKDNGENDKSSSMDTSEVASEPEIEDEKEIKTPGGHRAGYDAFMTGFSFATFWLRYKDSENIIEINDDKNKIYLCGKDHPLLIMKSQFSKNSADHIQKWNKLRETL